MDPKKNNTPRRKRSSRQQAGPGRFDGWEHVAGPTCDWDQSKWEAWLQNRDHEAWRVIKKLEQKGCPRVTLVSLLMTVHWSVGTSRTTRKQMQDAIDVLGACVRVLDDLAKSDLGLVLGLIKPDEHKESDTLIHNLLALKQHLVKLLPAPASTGTKPRPSIRQQDRLIARLLQYVKFKTGRWWDEDLGLLVGAIIGKKRLDLARWRKRKERAGVLRHGAKEVALADRVAKARAAKAAEREAAAAAAARTEWAVEQLPDWPFDVSENSADAAPDAEPGATQGRLRTAPDALQRENSD
jgi:hypothetical protein